MNINDKHTAQICTELVDRSSIEAKSDEGLLDQIDCHIDSDRSLCCTVYADRILDLWKLKGHIIAEHFKHL